MDRPNAYPISPFYGILNYEMANSHSSCRGFAQEWGREGIAPKFEGISGLLDEDYNARSRAYILSLGRLWPLVVERHRETV